MPRKGITKDVPGGEKLINLIRANCRALRMRAGLSIYKAADLIGSISGQYHWPMQVSWQENHSRGLAPGICEVMSKAYGCRADDFYKPIDETLSLPGMNKKMESEIIIKLAMDEQYGK